MSPHQTIAVSVRLFSIWLAIYSFRDIVTFYFEGTSRNYSHALPIGIAVFLVSAFLVVVLWLFPQTVARKLLASPVKESTPSASPDMWLAAGCTLIGLWVLTSAMPSLIRHLLIVHFADGGYEDNATVWLFYYLVEIAIALWLIFGTKGIRKLFLWAQTAGQNRTP
jgi:hypothetical protein